MNGEEIIAAGWRGREGGSEVEKEGSDVEVEGKSGGW